MLTKAKHHDEARHLIQKELDDLFYQRTRFTLWMGATFVPFFALLDYLLVPAFFWLFFSWRIGFALLILVLLHQLRRQAVRVYTWEIMFGAMLLCSLTITLMTVKLGGFTSGYYVGILLSIVGAFSILPLRILESLLLGGSMYLIYASCNLLVSWPLDPLALDAMIGNSFFFLTMIAVITAQCYDEIRMYCGTLLTQKNLQTINQELKKHTDNLEQLIEQRVLQLQESDIKFRELYDNIHDLVVLTDANYTIRMVNQYGCMMLGLSQDQLLERPLKAFLPTMLEPDIFAPLRRGEKLSGQQMQLLTGKGHQLAVEVSGNAVQMPGHEQEYQLIIRDISATKEIEQQVLKSNLLLDNSRQTAIFGLARLAEFRDEDTGAHLLRIREYTRILACEMAKMPEYQVIIDRPFIDDLCTSSILHDIGKIGIPDAILLKPGKLTAEEFRIMQKHCEYGYNALVSAEKDAPDLPFLRLGQEITLHHHEQWCGKGYPYGISGRNIPLSARIVTLADVYDALTSVRPYKAAFTHEEARTLIIDDIGRRFDPRVAAAFLKHEEAFIAVSKTGSGTPNA